MRGLHRASGMSLCASGRFTTPPSNSRATRCIWFLPDRFSIAPIWRKLRSLGDVLSSLFTHPLGSLGVARTIFIDRMSKCETPLRFRGKCLHFDTTLRVRHGLYANLAQNAAEKQLPAVHRTSQRQDDLKQNHAKN